MYPASFGVTRRGSASKGKVIAAACAVEKERECPSTNVTTRRGAPPRREFEAKKEDMRNKHGAVGGRCVHAMRISLFFASNSLWGGAAFVLGRCLSLSQPRTPGRHPYLSTRCHAVSRRSSPGTLCRSGARWLLSASEPPLQPRLAGVSDKALSTGLS